MRIFVTLVFALWASVSAAQEAQIEQTISDQIAAFEQEDVDTAFSFASPMIQGFFGTADRFGAMVQQGYPMVWRPDRFRFLELRETSIGFAQKVLFVDQAGKGHILEYEMIQLDERWRINGVRYLAPDPVA